jgi:hypothetical protein
MDWFKGKSTGNHGFYHQYRSFLKIFPSSNSMNLAYLAFAFGKLLHRKTCSYLEEHESWWKKTLVMSKFFVGHPMSTGELWLLTCTNHWSVVTHFPHGKRLKYWTTPLLIFVDHIQTSAFQKKKVFDVHRPVCFTRKHAEHEKKMFNVNPGLMNPGWLLKWWFHLVINGYWNGIPPMNNSHVGFINPGLTSVDESEMSTMEI